MKDKRMPPTIANGQICYFEMPSKDVAGSESFYRKVFEWNIRRQGDGSVAFDDAAGEVSGSWVLGRPPMREVGLLVYIMVDSVAATLEEVLANGGEIVHRSGCPGDYGAFPGSVGECVGVVSGAGEERQLGNCLPRAGRPAVCEAARREYSE